MRHLDYLTGGKRGKEEKRESGKPEKALEQEIGEPQTVLQEVAKETEKRRKSGKAEKRETGKSARTRDRLKPKAFVLKTSCRAVSYVSSVAQVSPGLGSPGEGG